MKPNFLISVVAAALFSLASAATPRADAASLVVRYTFDGNNGQPLCTLSQGMDGNFYGTTDGEATQKGSIVFELTPSSKFSDVHDFGDGGGTGLALYANTNDGGLIQDGSGNLFGMTKFGGTHGTGTVYEITAAGAFKVLHNFSALNSDDTNDDGADPTTALVLGSDGNFYGTTAVGGQHGDGTIFKLTPGGTLTRLHSFTGTSSGGDRFIAIAASLTQAADGAFYGTTPNGGTMGNGQVFKMTAAGTVTVLHNFSVLSNEKNDDGASPEGGLTPARDGNLYGTTGSGGTHGYGVFFKITPAGTLTVLHDFDGADAAATNGVMQASDGRFYGMSEGGGTNDAGTIFRITSSGTLTTLHNFSDLDDNNENSEGAAPSTKLIEPIPGTFIGTTPAGGTKGNGTIFELYVPPFVTSPATAKANVGSAFRYQITSNVHPAVYSVDGLSDELEFDDQTGLISGTPTKTGTLSLDVRASNDVGTGAKAVTVTVGGPLPAITSAATATAQVGQSFSYQIAATNSPTSYGVGGLRPGLSLNAHTGLITGTPTGSGTFTLTLQATNGGGTGTEILTLTIKPSTPAITSPLTASAKVGQPFSYQITATSSPTSYGVGGLFAGLTVNQQTGLITGTPTAAGTHSLDLRATNAGGTGHETLTLTVTN